MFNAKISKNLVYVILSPFNAFTLVILSLLYSGGSFPFGESGDSPFYFPDRAKNVKIFPVREIK